jgi:magnesium-transporting ATPase (P-type)
METWGGPEGLAKHLKTSTETGINWNDQERINRVDAFGPNSFPPPKIKTLWELIMENFEDQINRILLGAALVSLVIGCIQHGFPDGMLEGVSIMIALCIIIIVSSGNNYASERRLANLVAMADRQEVAVYRKGKNDETTTISYEDLVVGDLVQVEKGMKVPADCMLVKGDNVQSKEDALTGEPDDIDKTPLTEENYR